MATPWTAVHQTFLSFTISGICSNSCTLWCYLTIWSSVALFSFCLHFFPNIRVFSNELALHIRQPEHWSFRFSISPSNEYSELISFRIDWFDLLAVQRTLKSPLQHYNSKASVLWCSAYFMVHLSHPNLTTGKTVALTKQILVCKLMSLLFICCLGFP